jgi:cation diffusion facilitator family transporter
MNNSNLQRNTLVGLLFSVLLTIVKFVAGVLGSSSALVADAIESLADVFGSILVWQALRVAHQPADDRHPYGYGKAESLSALAVGVILIVAAGVIVIKAFREIVVPHAPPATWTIWVLMLIIVTKELLFRLVVHGANQHDSDAARADAWHHRADAVTSLAAMIGVAVAIWGPMFTGVQSLVLADEVAAILASGAIVVTGLGLIRPSIRDLLDAASEEMIELVTQVAGEVAGVQLVEKVWVRKSGSGFFVDMHLHVDPELSIKAAHSLSGKVKATLKTKVPRILGVLIHIEPSEVESVARVDDASVSQGPVSQGPVSDECDLRV